jgi:hypothetical protein
MVTPGFASLAFPTFALQSFAVLCVALLRFADPYFA